MTQSILQAPPEDFPKLQVDLSAIENNAAVVCALCQKVGVHVAGVVKFSDGAVEIAKAYAAGGCAQIAYTRDK